jgi:hypothetical protein
MTLPPCYSWSPVGERLSIPYEAPQGRRLNVIGGYVSVGPDAGTFRYAVYASLPKSKSKKQRKSPEEIAAASGLSLSEVGPIDSARFLAFLWQVAGRPSVSASDWKRARPLWIVLDNYSVHTGEAVKAAKATLEAANVHLFYLPSYSPELSDIEPIWQAVKHHEMQTRSHREIKAMKQAVEAALARKAETLQARHAETTNLLCRCA